MNLLCCSFQKLTEASFLYIYFRFHFHFHFHFNHLIYLCLFAFFFCVLFIYLFFAFILTFFFFNICFYLLKRKNSIVFFFSFQKNLDRKFCSLSTTIIKIFLLFLYNFLSCPVGWGWRIHRLLLCRGVRLPQWVSWYDTKQSDGKVPVFQELWGMQSTSSFPSLPGPLWPGVIAPERVLSMGQRELNCVLMQNWIV